MFIESAAVQKTCAGHLDTQTLLNFAINQQLLPARVLSVYYFHTPVARLYAACLSGVHMDIAGCTAMLSGLVRCNNTGIVL